jgi:hypothetical protein
MHPQLATTTMPPKAVAAIIVGSPDITSVSVPNPGRISKVKTQGSAREIKARNLWCKSNRAN